MSIDYTALATQPRLLLEATLEPLQGKRFQPTGFADLGPAVYTLPDDSQHLLLESAQSVANYLEKACWDAGENDLIEPLKGLPYVKIDCGRFGTTTTLHEFHRLNSPYLWKGDDNEKASGFRKAFCEKLGIKVPNAKKGDKDSDEGGSISVPGVLNHRKMTDAIFWFDPCSLIHGVFLEKLDGRMRVTRALSGFIEAAKVRRAESGGVKVDHVMPSPKKAGLDAKGGFGNVPYSKTEFVAEKITAFFNLDLALLRGYGLPEEGFKLMVAVSLLKIRRFLELDLRLRAACDLEVVTDEKNADGLRVTRPKEGFTIPTLTELEAECKALIKQCADKKLFADKPAESEFKLAPKDVTIELQGGAPVPLISDARKKEKLLSFSTAKGKKTLKLKAKLLESVEPEVLAVELFPDNEDLQKLVVEKCAGTDLDEAEPEDPDV
jgi:CRISPR-associated protein Csb1